MYVRIHALPSNTCTNAGLYTRKKVCTHIHTQDAIDPATSSQQLQLTTPRGSGNDFPTPLSSTPHLALTLHSTVATEPLEQSSANGGNWPMPPRRPARSRDIQGRADAAEAAPVGFPAWPPEQFNV
jgi:hypothetical protein